MCDDETIFSKEVQRLSISHLGWVNSSLSWANLVVDSPSSAQSTQAYIV